MLDFDLAALYGIESRALNQAVKRNIDRFPEDFMFQLTKGEWELLKSQFVTAKTYVKENADNLPSQIVIANGIEKKRFQPYAFTENGVAMRGNRGIGIISTRQRNACCRHQPPLGNHQQTDNKSLQWREDHFNQY